MMLGETLTLLFARSRPAVIVELLLSDFEQGDEVKLQFDRDVAEDDDELSSSNATQQRRRDVSSGSVLLYAESSQLEEGLKRVVGVFFQKYNISIVFCLF